MKLPAAENDTQNLKWPAGLQVLLKKTDISIVKVLVAVLAIGIVFLIWPRQSEQAAPQPAQLVDAPGSAVYDPVSVPGEEDTLERQLAVLLRSIAGAGNVAVDISISSQGEIRYGTNNRTERRTTQEQGQDGLSRVTEEEALSHELVMERDSKGQESPVIIGQMGPQISGAVVIADGANNHEVRLALAKATAALLNIPLYRVEVLARERGD
ncbi:MAG TPA: hypothetical protein DCY84_09320 [Firmicutes bacterium]|mgnify:CR=1 FL=1|jgi:stage III sporulation protein AG|nr:hypothetical protein [Bacillota bacterium]HBG43464.1 hypothetical protein [Bacillota bacterium]HBR25076.1 hypothetical protein [Bacillota bacterium]HCF91865.1 hypothetical protein [Bacillota bacterium]HCT36760.1 hypothetical protein [Bacillota bacterium]